MIAAIVIGIGFGRLRSTEGTQSPAVTKDDETLDYEVIPYGFDRASLIDPYIPVQAAWAGFTAIDLTVASQASEWRGIGTMLLNDGQWVVRVVPQKAQSTQQIVLYGYRLVGIVRNGTHILHTIVETVGGVLEKIAFFTFGSDVSIDGKRRILLRYHGESDLLSNNGTVRHPSMVNVKDGRLAVTPGTRSGPLGHVLDFMIP